MPVTPTASTYPQRSARPPCSSSRGTAEAYSLCVPEVLVHGLTFAESYAYLDDWVLGKTPA
ncbi:hypothetical protein ABT381_05590 [Streptomyces sp. NPDC000151]|uniref:hypothetical protein n=1 Tax=Streptomyces sp. NPDC000151 TaxID=3154244 RepID=UPI00332BABD5